MHVMIHLAVALMHITYLSHRKTVEIHFGDSHMVRSHHRSIRCRTGYSNHPMQSELPKFSYLELGVFLAAAGGYPYKHLFYMTTRGES